MITKYINKQLDMCNLFILLFFFFFVCIQIIFYEHEREHGNKIIKQLCILFSIQSDYLVGSTAIHSFNDSNAGSCIWEKKNMLNTHPVLPFLLSLSCFPQLA